MRRWLLVVGGVLLLLILLPGLFVREVRVVPTLASLLPGRPLAVDRVDLTRLVIAVRRDQAGHWELPVVPVAGTDTGKASGAGFVLDTLRLRDGAIRIVDDRLRSHGGPTATTISGVSAAMHASTAGVRIPRFSGYLGKTSGHCRKDPAHLNVLKLRYDPPRTRLASLVDVVVAVPTGASCSI